MKKCIIIMNPESGKVKSLNSKKDFYDILRKHGYDTEIKYTKKKKDATRIVEELENDVDLVISAGGDGTLNEVVTGNLHRKKKLVLANLPMGTTNDVANMYGYTKNYQKNLELLLNGVRKKVDVCYIDETPFVYVACLGDYIDMAYNTPRDLKKKYGKIAYILYGLRQLRNKIHRYHVKYKVDGVEHEGEYSFFFITNSSRVAGVDDIYYDVKMDDNMFEVALANPKTKPDILRILVQVTMKDVKEVPGITYYQTNDFEIEFLDKPKTSWCIDGEEYLSSHPKFKFKVDQKMRMLIPKTNAKKLFDK
ncbi:MAG TPA: diacylglycerol kinase family lipid kinase [Candidatus Faecimonas gallistercoris]|nr:diacylglycerol kinase family lipid kinase [Candidatus Faecimonas gallistercoris]